MADDIGLGYKLCAPKTVTLALVTLALHVKLSPSMPLVDVLKSNVRPYELMMVLGIVAVFGLHRFVTDWGMRPGQQRGKVSVDAAELFPSSGGLGHVF